MDDLASNQPFCSNKLMISSEREKNRRLYMFVHIHIDNSSLEFIILEIFNEDNYVSYLINKLLLTLTSSGTSTSP